MRRAIVSLILASAASLYGQTIPSWFPANSTVDWTAAGVPGGIPNRSTIFVNVLTTGNASYKCYGDNVHDDSGAIARALTDCPSNEVVYLPAATYLLSTNLLGFANDGVTLRGDGMGKTILNLTSTNNSGGLSLGSEDYPAPYNNPFNHVLGGFLKGSTNLVLDSLAGILSPNTGLTNNYSVGCLISISETNTPTTHLTSNAGQNPVGDPRPIVFTAVVTAVSSAGGTNLVTINHPLPLDFTNAPMTVGYYYVRKWDGVENLTVSLTNCASVYPFWWKQAYACWMQNVEIGAAANHYVYWGECVNCSIVGGYTHGSVSSGPNHEGIDLYGHDCFNLIENNICDTAGFPMIMLGDGFPGNMGNVIAYNFCTNLVSGSTVAGEAIGLCHGYGNAMNLAEGNVAQSLQTDGYYGSDQNETLFRNWFSGLYSTNLSWPFATEFDHWSDWNNVVGNVLGTPGAGNIYDPGTNSYPTTSPAVLLRFGFPDMGDSSFTGMAVNPSYPTSGFDAMLDLFVAPSTYVNGNFDYASNQVTWVGGVTNSLPGSLYLAGQPSWWSNSVPWPPIGSDLTPMTNSIPAQLRFDTINQGGGGTNPPVAFTGTGNPMMGL